jgi:hypothetical protein
MIKVDMSADDLDKQIELLKLYPEILEKHFVPVLKRDVKELETRIRPTIPVLSGKAQRMFRSKVTGKGINLTGQVGWANGKKAPWYINVVEHGAKAHVIEPKGKTVSGLGKLLSGKKFGHILHWGTVFATHVNHPGFSKRGFMAAGFSAMQAVINADMAQASEGVVKDLAL